MSNLLSFLSNAHIVQAIIIGCVFAFLTANIIMNIVFKRMTTTVNGWSTTTKCGKPGNGLLERAASARTLPAVNLVEEAAYWTTTRDSVGQMLDGRHNYILHFPSEQLPPNDAFWSLTLTDVAGFMIDNPIGRYSLGDRSGLVPNSDGSIDIYIQSADASGLEANWLPAPSGNFKLMLRAYLPGPAILKGEYSVPPVSKVV